MKHDVILNAVLSVFVAILGAAEQDNKNMYILSLCKFDVVNVLANDYLFTHVTNTSICLESCTWSPDKSNIYSF